MHSYRAPYRCLNQQRCTFRYQRIFVRKVSWLVRRTFCFVSACFCTRINVPARITFDIAEDCQLFACKSARSRLITHLASLARGSRQRNKAVFGRAQRAASGQAYAQAYQRNRERRHQEALSRQPRSFAPIWVEAGNGLTSRSSRRRYASSEITAISCAIMCSRHSRSTTAARLNASVGWPACDLVGIRIWRIGFT